MSDLTPSAKVRQLYEDHIGYWQPYRDAMKQERAFLDGDRYQDDAGTHNRDRRLIQIRGQELQDTIRHIVAKATEKPRTIEARPIDHQSDPDIDEIVVALLEWETSNTWKGFEECYEEALMSAREARLGIIWLDWDPDCGPYGEILPRWGDGTRYMWDPSYGTPHHPRCDWLLEERRLDVDWIHANYKGSDWVFPDRDATSIDGTGKPNIPLLRHADGQRAGAMGNPTDNKATLLFCWYKNDRTEGATREKAGSYKPIQNPADRYMHCTTCGYRSPTQGDLQDEGAIPQDGELPSEIQAGCPDDTCSSDLTRVDAVAVDEHVLAYTRGHRLLITAPFSAAPGDAPVYDGPWPVPECRSFPGFFFTASVKPGRPIGSSDTNDLWDQQIASDNLRTLAVQRTYEHRSYWELPAVGINDASGRRYMFREDQFNVMFRDGTASEFGPLDVRLHQGTGLDPMFLTTFNVVQQALTQYRGTADLGLTQQSSKDIPASSLAQLYQQAEVPTEHFIRRKNRELGRGYGILWDMVRATTSAAKLKRLRIDGIDHITDLMSADDLPNYDFVISETPTFNGLEEAKATAFDKLVQIAQAMPELVSVYAEIHNLPRSVVRKVEEWVQSRQPSPLQLGAAGMGEAGAAPDPRAGVPSPMNVAAA